MAHSLEGRVERPSSVAQRKVIKGQLRRGSPRSLTLCTRVALRLLQTELLTVSLTYLKL